MTRSLQHTLTATQVPSTPNATEPRKANHTTRPTPTVPSKDSKHVSLRHRSVREVRDAVVQEPALRPEVGDRPLAARVGRRLRRHDVLAASDRATPALPALRAARGVPRGGARTVVPTHLEKNDEAVGAPVRHAPLVRTRQRGGGNGAQARVDAVRQQVGTRQATPSLPPPTSPRQVSRMTKSSP